MNSKQICRTAAVTGATLAVVLAAGCQSEETYQTSRAAKARSDHFFIATRYVPQGEVFSLPTCIEYALKNNLDIEVKKLGEQISQERKTAAVLGMLPQVNLGYTLDARSNQPGSSSYNVYTGQESLTPSKSDEKTERTFTVDIALSTIDLGLAYFNSVQAQDKSLIETSQRKRAVQTLSYNVAKKYYQVAAAQYAVETTSAMLERSGQIETILNEIEKDKSLSPLRAMDEKKRFNTLQKRLMEYQTNYENSCVELKALMGLTPNHKIKLETGFLKKLIEVKLPRVDQLEQLALRERPELNQSDIQQHISVVEARKAIIKMFPNTRIFADYNDYSNKYLYNNRWWTLGLMSSIDLFSIPQQVFEYRTQEAQARAIEGKTVALSIAVMSQVHLAYAAIMESRRQFELDDRVFVAYNDYYKEVRKIYDAGGDYAELDMDRLDLETADVSISRAFSLSNYYMSYYRLINSMGLDSLNPELLEKMSKELKPIAVPAAVPAPKVAAK